MKIFLSIAASIFAVVPVALAEGISHAVRAATIFTDRAVITRTGTANLKQGRNEIIFDGIADHLATRSIRAGKDLPEGVKIVGVSWERRISASIDNALFTETEEKLSAAKTKKMKLSDEISAAEARVKMLARYREFIGKSIAKNGEKNARADVQKISDEAQKNFDEIEEKSAQLLKIEREISELEDFLEKISGNANARRTLRVVVDVDSSREGAVEIPIAYTTFSARWTPSYDIRVFSNRSRSTEFSCSGLISQNTGEDWRDVQLTLSTARARTLANPPSPTTTSVSGEAVDPATRKIVTQTSDVAIAGTARDELAPNEDLSAKNTHETAPDAPVVFSLGGGHTVQSGGNAQCVHIADAMLEDVAFEFEAAPAVRHGVYLRATTKKGVPFPIISGFANLFRDANFIGKTSLNYAPLNSEFSFFAGNADGFSTACKTLPTFHEKDGGFFSKTGNGDIFKSEIYTIANRTGTAQKIRVRSQIEVSEIDDVKISILEKATRRVPATTPDYVLERDTGLIFWNVEIPAKGAKNITLSTRTERDS